jgi:hypothetical protein
LAVDFEFSGGAAPFGFKGAGFDFLRSSSARSSLVFLRGILVEEILQTGPAHELFSETAAAGNN